MIELMLLGFLATEGPLHGYELRKRMSHLHGWARSISDGTIYPAIDRLVRAGAIAESVAKGEAAAPRRLLSLTDVGRVRLQAILRDAKGNDITDFGRFSAVLAFLSLLSELTEREAVLRRRLEFLERPVGFFFDGNRPVPASEVDDPYRAGLLQTARATRSVELAWLRGQLAEHVAP